MRGAVTIIGALAILLSARPGAAEDKVLRIYQDADLTNHVESSRTIQLGMEVAFGEVGNTVNGYKIEFRYLDHRGNVIRSLQNYKAFLDDDRALAVFSGAHSPPLIKNRTFINENEALTLVPWAAGGPITRYPSPENWVFRLSVDDTQAADVIIDHAVDKIGCKSPRLMLENTPWGDSNRKSMTEALVEKGLGVPELTRFAWGTSVQDARLMLRQAIDAQGDCVILVANAVEGAVFADAMLGLPAEKRIPIISHWGIAAGTFHKVIYPQKRALLDLSFIQTCFAFTANSIDPFAKKVFRRLAAHTGGRIEKPEDLSSAVGFIHAYDLSRLLIAAMTQVALSGDVTQDRRAVRNALEAIDGPVRGLVKTYRRPFSRFESGKNVNAHEALGRDNYCMARFDSSDAIVLID